MKTKFPRKVGKDASLTSNGDLNDCPLYLAQIFLHKIMSLSVCFEEFLNQVKINAV